MSNILKKSIDAMRIAPAGIALGTVDTVGLAAEIKVLTDATEVYHAAPFPFIVAGIAVAGLKIAKQYRLKEHIELLIEEKEFDDRIMAVTTNTWCARQTARVVCKDHDLLPEYEAVCKETEAKAKFTWIPHIS